MEVDASAFPKLAEKEPILGELLRGATHVTNGQAILSLEPWLEGALKVEDAAPTGGGIKVHRSSAIFYAGKTGQELAFRFVLVSVENGSSLSYSGRLSDAGREISYSTTQRDKTGKDVGHTSPVHWRLDGAAPTMEKMFSPSSSAPTIEVDASAFPKLAEKEPILGELLRGPTELTNGKVIMSLEPWLEGFLRYSGVIYHSSAIFYPEANGQVAFRFVLLNVENGTSLSYTGRLNDAGRQISYSTTQRDKTGKALGPPSPVEWRLDQIAE
jgi:hypothetical protein